MKHLAKLDNTQSFWILFTPKWLILTERGKTSKTIIYMYIL